MTLSTRIAAGLTGAFACLAVAAPSNAQILDSHTIVNPNGTGFTCTFIGKTTTCNHRTRESIRRSQQHRIESLNNQRECYQSIGIENIATRRMDECLNTPVGHVAWKADRNEATCQSLLSKSRSLGMSPERSWYSECNYN